MVRSARRALMLETATNEPAARCSCMAPTQARMQSHGPRALTRMTRSNSSGSASVSRPEWPTPAVTVTAVGTPHRMRVTPTASSMASGSRHVAGDVVGALMSQVTAVVPRPGRRRPARRRCPTRRRSPARSGADWSLMGLPSTSRARPYPAAGGACTRGIGDRPEAQRHGRHHLGDGARDTSRTRTGRSPPAAADLQVVRPEDERFRDAGVCPVMKAAVYYETGAPDVFRYEDVPDPIGRSGRRPDRRRGDQHRGRRHPQPPGRRPGPGAARGRLPVRRHGGRGRGRRRGLRGRGSRRHRGARRLPRRTRATPDGFAWKIPDDVSTDDAACVPVPFGTADDCLFEFGHLQAGETALIHAGAGGVGIAAIQMAKRAGARVFATASSDDRLERLQGARTGRGHQLRHP